MAGGAARSFSVGESRVYVYAVLGGPIVVPRRLRATVEVLSIAGMFVALQRMTELPALSEEALRRQHRIIVDLHRSTNAILPVRFGALLDAGELHEIVRLRRAVLSRALTQVRGREQMTVRIFGPQSPSKGPSRGDPSSGLDYLRQRAASARPALSRDAKRIAGSVASLVTAQSIDAGRGEVQVTINHLIERGNSPQYRRMAKSTASRIEPAISVVVSGPWPPFAFAPDIWSADLPEPPARPRGTR